MKKLERDPTDGELEKAVKKKIKKRQAEIEAAAAEAAAAVPEPTGGPHIAALPTCC